MEGASFSALYYSNDTMSFIMGYDALNTSKNSRNAGRQSEKS